MQTFMSELQCRNFIVYFLVTEEKQDVVGLIIVVKCEY